MIATRIAVLASALAVPPMPAAAAQERDSAHAVSPAPVRSSVFEGYRRYSDEEIADWRASNDTVARIGGHAGSIAAERNISAADQRRVVPTAQENVRAVDPHGGRGPAQGRP